MKIFDVYSNESEEEDKKHEAVKRGFSWTGFFFGALWAFLNELYVLGLLLFITYIGLLYLKPHAGRMIVIPHFLIPLTIGWLGNDFKRSKLIKKGYTFSKTVNAKIGRAHV